MIGSRTAEKRWSHRFSHYKPMGIFSDVQGQLTPQSVVRAGRNSNSSELSRMSSLPEKYKKDRMKNRQKKWRHRFLHYNHIEAFCCHGNQSSDPIWSKTKCSLSLNPMMLQIKFSFDQPIGFRDIHVWKCEHTDGRTPARLVYYKLTLWAIGSGELKIHFHYNIEIFSRFVRFISSMKALSKGKSIENGICNNKCLEYHFGILRRFPLLEIIKQGIFIKTHNWAASWENQQSAYAKTKTQSSFAVTAKLISAFVFATWIVQYLSFLNTKFQDSSHLQ